MSVVRGRPPGLAGGINGASRAYCSSLRACPAPKSPTRARLSAVHMACLREGLLPSRTGRRPACATCSPRRRRLLKQPLKFGPKVYGSKCPQRLIPLAPADQHLVGGGLEGEAE